MLGGYYTREAVHSYNVDQYLTCRLLDLQSDTHSLVKVLSNLVKILLAEASACQGRGSCTTLKKLRHN